MSPLEDGARQDVYRLIDRVLETGEPLEIVRKGRKLRLVPDERMDVLSRLRPHPDYLVGDPEEIISMDWSSEWDQDRALHP